MYDKLCPIGTFVLFVSNVSDRVGPTYPQDRTNFSITRHGLSSSISYNARKLPKLTCLWLICWPVSCCDMKHVMWDWVALSARSTDTNLKTGGSWCLLWPSVRIPNKYAIAFGSYVVTVNTWPKVVYIWSVKSGKMYLIQRSPPHVDGGQNSGERRIGLKAAVSGVAIQPV